MPFLARFFHIMFFLISSWINHAQDIPSSQLIISQRISKGSLEQNIHFFLILPFNVPYLGSAFWYLKIGWYLPNHSNHWESLQTSPHRVSLSSHWFCFLIFKQNPFFLMGHSCGKRERWRKWACPTMDSSSVQNFQTSPLFPPQSFFSWQWPRVRAI